jgi:hypothetical protein
METIAVYWEPVIKIYGIAERTGLSMVSFVLPGSGFEPLLRRTPEDCLLAFARPAGGGDLRLHLLFEGRPGRGFMDALGLAAQGSRVDIGVELVYFQGPHFGDRYGIAHAAIRALGARMLPVLAMTCTGSSVYLVLPQKSAAAARKALTEAFLVPGNATTTTDGQAHD